MSFGKAVVKCRHFILIAALLLLIPAAIGYKNTRINYDMLIYLPESIDTIRGQHILEDEFGTGAIAMVVAEDKTPKEAAALKQEILKVPHVKDVLWYDSVFDLSIPTEMMPERVREAFMKDDATLMAVTFDTTTSDDDTLSAITAIRSILPEKTYLQGVSAVLEDTKELAEHEEPIYVTLAVILATAVTACAMDTFLAPILFLISIGIAIIYNLGSNIFLGQICYVTKALAAVLQLGVTMDYSIFLWQSFKECRDKNPGHSKEAMAEAINRTLQSVVGSSVTTIAGFAALCFMSFSFGLDVGVVMMKGVALGVISCVTILPSLILLFEKAIDKTQHRPLLPALPRLPAFVQKHYRAVLVIAALLWIPAIYGYTHLSVYYDVDRTLPRTLPSIEASEELKDQFDMNAVMMILSDKSLPAEQASAMCDALKQADGVKNVIGVRSLLGASVPDEMIPDKIRSQLSSDNWNLILLTSQYQPGGDEIREQIEDLDSIIQGYDPKAMLIGDAPCLKDLVDIADHDFNIVNWASILIIFVIIIFVFRSLSLPTLLVFLIEEAIFLNMSLSFYEGNELVFIASIVIGTIQLGSTVDYAILMTSRYQRERFLGRSREDSIRTAHGTSISSILCSGFTFFAATFGVGLYSNISMISSLCILMARGALISTAVVLLVLPAVLMLFDPLIIKTSRGFRPEDTQRKVFRSIRTRSV